MLLNDGVSRSWEQSPCPYESFENSLSHLAIERLRYGAFQTLSNITASTIRYNDERETMSILPLALSTRSIHGRLQVSGARYTTATHEL